jgi:DNA-binding NarL/FixJ family response regulator
VLLTDLGLPDGSGLEVIALAMQVQPQCEALVISMFGDEENVLSSIEAGASGYIHKDAAPGDVAQAILDLKAGASPISPMIARRVLAKYRSMARAPATVTLENTKNLENIHDVSVISSDDAIDSGAFLDAQDGPTQEPRPMLSVREQEVLELVSRGFSYQEIAKLQIVSVYTVQTHIKHLYAKLAVHSRSEAVYEAQRLGLLRMPK